MTFGEYCGVIKDVAMTTLKGMGITWRVFWKVNTKGAITIQYPEVKDKLPNGSRGLLFNDVDDCISCRQCAVVCPVDCIYIEADKKAAGEPADFTKGGVKKTLKDRQSSLRKFVEKYGLPPAQIVYVEIQMSTRAKGVQELKPAEVKRLIDQRPDAKLLDVRESWEVQLCRIPDSRPLSPS